MSMHSLKRGSDGRFSNGKYAHSELVSWSSRGVSADLANILHLATETSASAFKARGIPEALKVVELMGIEQARAWGTCSVSNSVWPARRNDSLIHALVERIQEVYGTEG